MPLPTKLVLKIQSGQSVEMKELLTDNTALQRQLDDIQPQLHPVYTLPGRACPCLREISTLLEWIYSSDPVARNLRTYVRLILREARRHSGSERVEDDKVFQQQAAMDLTLHGMNSMQAC